MKLKGAYILLRLLFANLVFILPSIAPASQELFNIPLEELANIEITTAAKVPEIFSKTTATVNIVSAAEIRQMGARTIHDILNQLPGITSGLNQYGDQFIAIRGIRTPWSENVLLLLDGHLLNDVRSGSATYQFLDSLPVDNIARIEVVLGPGSSLYGANAFLGVINIITRHPDNIHSVDTTAKGEIESAGTVAHNYNLLAGGNISNNWQGSLNINYLDAPGPELDVPSDAFGRSGVADMNVERLDMQGNLANDHFNLRTRYLKREAGDAFGGLGVLNHESNQQVEYIFLDAEYKTKPANNTDLSLRGYYDHQETDNYYTLIPAGSMSAGNPYFAWNTTGLIGNSLAQETITGAEIRLDYNGISSHTITSGLTSRYEKLHDVRTLSNFDPNPLPEVTDVSSYYNWIDEANRDILSFYIQDLWDIQPDLRATLGARYDHYSDFGSTTNPRLGLIWQASTDIAARISYGTAFRAPSFTEQFVKNNPAILGNPNLKPEKISTWELGLQWSRKHNRIAVTLFHNNMRHLIDSPPGSTMYENVGNATVYGAEIEVRHHFVNGTDIKTNYSYANPEYKYFEPSTQIPHHLLNFTTNIPLTYNIKWNVSVHWQSEIERNGSDTRSPIDSVFITNTALVYKPSDWEISVAINNLTDAEYATAAPAGTIAADFTAPGRSAIFGVKYAF